MSLVNLNSSTGSLLSPPCPPPAICIPISGTVYYLSVDGDEWDVAFSLGHDSPDGVAVLANVCSQVTCILSFLHSLKSPR